VIGRGKIGINSGFLDQSGPNLIQDAFIEGFDTGIVSQWIWGETLSRITIRNCRSNGVVVSANAVGIEDLTVENTPVAIRNEVPNNWGHWGGVIAVVGGRFTGGSPEQPAILNQSVLYARDVKTRGFKMALQSSAKGGNMSGPAIGEYASGSVKHLFDSPSKALQLAIKPEPDFPWRTTRQIGFARTNTARLPATTGMTPPPFRKRLTPPPPQGRRRSISVA